MTAGSVRKNFIRILRLPLFALFVLQSLNARGANFNVTNDPKQTCSAIELEGSIQAGDYNRFVETLIRGQYGSPEFMAAYDAAFAGKAPETAGKYERLSLAWCIEQYTASGRVKLPPTFFKVVLQNNAGVALGSGATRKQTLKIAPVA